MERDSTVPPEAVEGHAAITSEGQVGGELVPDSATVADVQRFADADKRFAQLPENLHRVAVLQAALLLTTPAEELPFLAGGLDDLTLADSFARHDALVEESLLLNWEQARCQLYRRGCSDAYVHRVATQKLRRAVARREVRRQLAHTLGYQPGHKQAVARSADFQTATALATAAIKALSPD